MAPVPEHLSTDIDEIAGRIHPLAEALAGKTVLLSGGQGFLGRYFVDVVARLNAQRPDARCRLLVLDNLITAAKGGLTGSPARRRMDWLRIIRHDVIKPYRPVRQVHFVVHMAGIASPYYYRAYPLETLEVATLGTKNLLRLAHEHRARMLYFSSSEIYGDPDPKHVPTPESYRGNVSCHGPRACYDESKRLGETMCGIFAEKYGTAVTLVRPFNVFGPGMSESDYRVLPNFASRIKAGQPLHVYGTGRQTRTFCYISDAMAGFFLALLKGAPGEAYNIGTPEPEVSMLELARHVEEVLGRRVSHRRIEYPDSYPGDEPSRRCPDITKARLQLGYEPRVPFRDGLKRFLHWADKAFTGKPA